MILFPAIDLKDGQCVRLEKGDMARATVFNGDPAAQARRFAEAGFEWLHVVDLNGAFAGKSVNADAIGAIRKLRTIRIMSSWLWWPFRFSGYRHSPSSHRRSSVGRTK